MTAIEQREAICEWLIANGVDPCEVPLNGGLHTVRKPDGTRTIRYSTVVGEQREHPLTADTAIPSSVPDATDWEGVARQREADLDGLRDALNSVHRTMVHDSRDWALDRRDAWLYAILIGWTCEDDHVHDDDCLGDDPLIETARAHGWDDDTVARLRTYRAAIAALGTDGSGQPADRAELPTVIVRITNQED